jgi:hypothetical protein
MVQTIVNKYKTYYLSPFLPHPQPFPKRGREHCRTVMTFWNSILLSFFKL